VGKQINSVNQTQFYN